MQCQKEKLRIWLANTCSILLKLFIGYPKDKKVKHMWRAKPKNWPESALFYDPYTKSKGRDNNVQLLKDILNCIQEKGILLNCNIKEEIEAWSSNDQQKLVYLFTVRQAIEQIDSDLNILASYSSVEKYSIKVMEWMINFRSHTKREVPKKLHFSEAMREAACMLCKICHGINPNNKVYSMWKFPPVNWPDAVPYVNPYNRNDRCNKWDDERLSKALLSCCQQNCIEIPISCHKIVRALESNDKAKLIKSIAVWKSIARIEKAVIKLSNDDLLQKEDVLRQLNEVGLVVHAESKRLTNEKYLQTDVYSKGIRLTHLTGDAICTKKRKMDTKKETDTIFQHDNNLSFNDKLPNVNLNEPTDSLTRAETDRKNIADFSFVKSSLDKEITLSNCETSNEIEQLLDVVDVSDNFRIDNHFAISLDKHLYCNFLK